MEVLVTDAGFVLTLDNWHNLGYGQVVVFYAPGGELLKSYELTDLYDPKAIERIPHSVSSRAWRRVFGFVDPDAQTRVYVTDHRHDTLVFEVATGRVRRPDSLGAAS